LPKQRFEVFGVVEHFIELLSDRDGLLDVYNSSKVPSGGFDEMGLSCEQNEEGLVQQ
jgi:hypothetical protein